MPDPSRSAPEPVPPLVTLDSGSADAPLDVFLAHLPRQPGVYLMFDRRNQVLYVGKARDLYARVNSYFAPPPGRSVKEAALISRVVRIECMVTSNEVDALVLEANLIKHHRPRYNIYLTDDKSYPYIRVTDEAFPRLRKTRRVVRDGSRYYGPFPSVRDMNVLLRTVSRLFYARSCDDPLPFPPGRRECLDYHIGRCLAPCTGRISPAEYRRMMEDAERFLAGGGEAIAARLEKEMQAAADALDYERAARLRDQIRGIERVAARQRIVTREAIDIDVIGLGIRDDLVLAVVLEVRGGKLIGRRAHRLHVGTSGTPEQAAILTGFLQQYYLGGREIPRVIILPSRLRCPPALEASLARARGGAVDVVASPRGERKRLQELAEQNVRQLLHEHSLTRQEDGSREALRSLALALGLPEPPQRIEAFDISHVHGAHAVAGLVVFTEGRPDRRAYRRYRIRGGHGGDDFASMREVVGRRYARVRAEGRPWPDLVLIDGGRGQLEAAVGAIRDLGITPPPIVGLAKRLEQVFRPGESAPHAVPPGSPGHLLLRRIRDEVHRYAVTYHRRLRGKESLESRLDAIPGVGPTRRRRLLSRFGSVAAIAAAGPDVLAAVPGIGPKLAREILRHVAGRIDQDG